MFLQAYDFQVIYVPGRTNQAADALSRHPLPPGIQAVNTFDWVQLQDNDEKIQQMKSEIHKHSSLALINRIVYKVIPQAKNVSKNNLLVVVPKAVVQDILKQYHDSSFGGHFGYKKTKAKILQNKLWWSNMEEDIKKYCASCQECQVNKGYKSKQYHEGSTNGSHPFQRVAIDFWGPLPEAGYQQYKYILVIVDTFTKFVELYPVKSTSGEDVAQAFYNNYILKHGIPSEILQDNGPPFSSMFHSQLTNLLGSENLYTPAYHPQSNGIVERFMATLRRMILSYTDQANIKNEWYKNLRLIQFVYNNTVHSTTGFTPFFLVHGRHPRTPLVTADEGTMYEHYKSPPQEFASKLQEKLNCAFDMVDTYMIRKSQNEQENPYELGQQILLFNQALSNKKKPRKLMFDWIGPFSIVNVKTRSTVDVQDIKTKKTIYNVHISRIKLIKQRDSNNNN